VCEKSLKGNMRRTFAFITAFVLITYNAMAETPQCSVALSSGIKEFNPEPILLKHGLLPNEINMILDSRDAQYPQIYLYYKKRLIGFINISPVSLESEAQRIVETHVKLEKPFQGKGLGTLLYLAMNSFIRTLMSDVLVSSSLDPSNKSKVVWDRFVDAKIAYYRAEYSRYFLVETVDDNLRKFVETHSIRRN
jgi:hypothetical protein